MAAADVDVESAASAAPKPLRRASKTMVSMQGLEQYLANQAKLRGQLYLRDKIYQFLHAPGSSPGASAYAILSMLTVIASVAIYLTETVEDYGEKLQPHMLTIDISLLTVPPGPAAASPLPPPLPRAPLPATSQRASRRRHRSSLSTSSRASPRAASGRC